MSGVEVNSEELKVIKKKFDNLVELRVEHIEKLDNMADSLRSMKSNGFIEGMVEKIDDHTNDVKKVQISNLEYNSNFLEDYDELMSAIDESKLC